MARTLRKNDPRAFASRFRLALACGDQPVSDTCLSFLLNAAIQTGCVEAVRMLIEEFGANPALPYSKVDGKECYPVTEVLRCSVQYPSDDNNQVNEEDEESICCQILRILLAQPSVVLQLKISDGDFRSNVLHFLMFNACKCAPDSCNLFISRVTPEFYINQTMTPIDYFAQNADEIFRDGEENLINVVIDVVVPFLKQGSNSQRLDRYFLVKLLKFDMKHSERLSGRKFFLSRLLVESLWNNRPGKVPASLAANPLFASFFQCTYPRTLQQHCRTVILTSLPCGPARFSAIGQLQLPMNLCNFLQFSDFIQQH